MKILYFSDAHFTSRQPIRRIDNFRETQLNKLKTLFQMAYERKVDFILEGGDLFDKQLFDFEFFAEVVRLFMENKEKKIPYYKVLGNHDMIGYNLDSYKISAVGFLEKLSLIEIISSKLDIENLRIISFPFSKNLPQKKIRMFKDKQNKHIGICCVHNMLTDKSGFPFDHLAIDEIDWDCDLVLCGHWHLPFMKKINNIRFLNLGSFCRLNIVENHIPSFVIIDTDEWSFDIIPVGKESSEVFQEKKQETKTKDFLVDLKSVDFNFETVWDMLQNTTNLDKDVYNECDKRLVEAEKNIS